MPAGVVAVPCWPCPLCQPCPVHTAVPAVPALPRGTARALGALGCLRPALKESPAGAAWTVDVFPTTAMQLIRILIFC
jgi:hypothetical protein